MIGVRISIFHPGEHNKLSVLFCCSHRRGKPRIYFYAGFIAYVLGLLTTIGVMHFFRAAQPALLYLVPSCLGIPFLAATINGDFSALIRSVCAQHLWIGYELHELLGSQCINFNPHLAHPVYPYVHSYRDYPNVVGKKKEDKAQ